MSDEPHAVGAVRCDVCQHRWVAVVHADRCLLALECPGCHHLTGFPETDPDDEDDDE